MRTNSKFLYYTEKKINDNWCAYDKITARAQLAKYGVIFMDAYGQPIDDELRLKEVVAAWHFHQHLQKAKPVLFNTEMVRAIEDGRKTVTRRLVKPQPTYSPNEGFSWKGFSYGTDLPPTLKGACHNFKSAAPYKPGDILYVRETWCKGRVECGEESDGRDALYISQCTGEDDYIHKEYALRHNIGIEDIVWRPSIHMPKGASRILLKVTRVRLEQLQEITEEQAEREGCKSGFYEYKGAIWGQEDTEEWTAVEHFQELWDSTIKKAALQQYGWKANPWVWVIEFEKLKTL